MFFLTFVPSTIPSCKTDWSLMNYVIYLLDFGCLCVAFPVQGKYHAYSRALTYSSDDQLWKLDLYSEEYKSMLIFKNRLDWLD